MKSRRRKRYVRKGSIAYYFTEICRGILMLLFMILLSIEL